MSAVTPGIPMAKAAEYLHDHADYLFTFSGTLDGIWARKNWEAIKDRLVPGGMILFSDNQFQPNGVRIRIVGIKDYINDPHRPELELSNETVGQTVSGRIAQLETQEVTIDESARAGRQYTKRTFRDAKETMQALNDALDSFKGEFTEGISPITINTMQLLVGSEQCQFEFVEYPDENAPVVEPRIEYDGATRKLTCGECYVKFSITKELAAGEPEWKYAKIPEFISQALNGEKAFYLYLLVSINNVTHESNHFSVSEKALSYEYGTYRRLLVGILDKVEYGNRTWCPMYGYTEITPGRIRVNKIISTDGKTYFDLANNEIGGRINFKDGLVSGLIGVAGSTGAMKAGMNGEGNSDTDIRFWAGANEANMGNAPFQVYQNGKVILSDAEIKGFITNSETIITKDNYTDYLYDDGFMLYLYNVRGNLVFDKSFSSINKYITIFAPSIYDGNTENKYYEYMLKMIDKTVIIKNKSGVGIGFTGNFFLKSSAVSGGSFPLEADCTAVIRGQIVCTTQYKIEKISIGWRVLAVFDEKGNVIEDHF